MQCYLGYGYSEIGENDKSIESYQKALSINPENSSALNNIALRYKEKGELLEALEYLNRAIDVSNKKELYYQNRIGVLRKLNSNDRIIDDYISLININPNKKEYYESLIEVLDKENRSKDIENYYNKAINHFKDQNPEMSNHFTYKQGEYFGKNGREVDAIDLFQSLIDNDYKSEYCYIKIADLKSNIGQDEEAIDILENGLKTNPRLSSLYLYKAFIESNTSIDNAKKTIDEGGNLINNEGFFFGCGRFFNQKNKLSLAKHCYEGAFNLIESKLEDGEIKEGDIMNYYETCVILQKPLDKFESDYRLSIASEKYQIVLTVIDSLKKLIQNFNDTEKQQVLEDIKSLNIEAKDKDLLNWNFGDLYWFIKSTKSEELANFSSKIIEYIERKISFEEI
jgi:tetratricopeptide (TPR) repeat protein